MTDSKKTSRTSADASETGGKRMSAKERLNNYLLEKLVRWVIAERVDEGKPSWFRWDAADKKLLSKIIADPDKAGLHLDKSDTKYRKFFQSIIDNGFNTADVQLFYRYRDQLPLRKLNWAFDLRDFEHGNGALRSTVKLPVGFYMIELQTRPSRFASRIPIGIHRSTKKLDTPKTLEEGLHSEDDFAMPVISHRLNKRLVWLRTEGYVDLVSDHVEGIKSITHLKFARTTRSFMIDRMMKKLGQEFNAKRHDNMQEEAFENLWKNYHDRFGYEYDPVAAYQRFLSKSESIEVVDKETQLADLTEWLKQPLR
jgi:hypothetical protein